MVYFNKLFDFGENEKREPMINNNSAHRCAESSIKPEKSFVLVYSCKCLSVIFIGEIIFLHSQSYSI